jgi:SAM-dependent methyltransferase
LLLPEIYHAHHTLDQADIPFWLQLAAQSSGPVLELGCGTGRVSLALAQAGCQVFGLDNDLSMLRYFAKLAGTQNADRVHLLQADMRRFHLAERFGLILIPCNTLSTLALPDLKATLACVAPHLRAGGIFAASLPNPYLLARLPGRGRSEVEEIFRHPLDGEPVQASSAWQRSEAAFTVYWYYDHLLPDGQVERSQAVIHHQRFSENVYLDELNMNGFRSIQLFGDVDRSPYRKTSPSLILVASK